MRRLTVALLTIGLVCANAAPTMAQSPSASPEPAGQRVEVPEAGFALTFPVDWEVGIDISDLPGEGGTFAVVSGQDSASDVTCEVYLYGPCSGEPFGDCAAGLDEFAARMVATYESYEDFEGVVEQAPVTSAVEYAVRIDIEWAADATFGTFYVFTDGKDHDTLLCGGSERPEDRWLSIAETFEFLPAQE